MAGAPLPGVYVHIPFCLRRCDYCDFTTFAGRDEAIPAYVDALVAHLSRDAMPGTAFGSLFVGGGTPTYLPPADLRRVLEAAGAAFGFVEGAERTVEANPETVTPEVAAALVDGGANRVSLGAQSFDDRVLGVLGRWHDPASVAVAVERLRAAGIDRLSLDLGVTHVSAYALTVESGTPYAVRARREPALVPDDDVQARRMAIAEEVLGAAGLQRYEISNWAVPGHESVHNRTYWRGGDWLAFGSGAHGSWEGRRWWLVRDPEKYARLVADGREPVAGEERPDADAVRLERLMMGLRLVEGVPRDEVEPVDAGSVARLIGGGLLTLRGDGSGPGGHRLALTPAGMPLAGAVIRELA